ncbi:MAG: hypothetical protein ACREQQ_04235 [Candidatus Binatia bacterium]
MALAMVTVTVSLVSPAFAEKPERPRLKTLRPGPVSVPSARGFDPEREAVIRKARSEIEKNPGQKKFILFRYGLHEEDVR